MRAMHVALLASALAACTDFDSLDRGVCGNGIIEPGEDCDSGDATCVRCAVTCDEQTDCPTAAYACGTDGLCHAPDGGMEEIDAGVDAGEVDAGLDAGDDDAGIHDAGHDAGELDAGADAGTPDAGEPDAGETTAPTAEKGVKAIHGVHRSSQGLNQEEYRVRLL